LKGIKSNVNKWMQIAMKTTLIPKTHAPGSLELKFLMLRMLDRVCPVAQGLIPLALTALRNTASMLLVE
jgi:hypothetical protein